MKTEMLSELRQFLDSLPDIRGKRIYIWGTGNTTQLYLEGFARIPDFRIEAYVDNNPAKQGTTLGGIPVLAPSELKAAPDMMILVCTGQPAAWKSISAQLAKTDLPFAYVDAGIWGLYKAEIMQIFQLLEDPRSKSIYLHILKTRSACLPPDEDAVCGDQYFSVPAFQERSSAETFIDCGAFVGDTIEQYLFAHEGVCKKLIGFEPDPDNMKAMQHRAERLKQEWNLRDQMLILYPYAVGDQNTVQYLERCDANNGLGSKMHSAASGNTDACQTVTLTDYLCENCFVKADIESYEYRMLTGAEQAIRQYRPKMAVCIYHNAVDFVTIPLLVHALCPAHNLRIRQHSFHIADTVLYAYDAP